MKAAAASASAPFIRRIGSWGGAIRRCHRPKTLSKVLIIVAAEALEKRIGLIRMALIEDFGRKPSTASFKIRRVPWGSRLYKNKRQRKVAFCLTTKDLGAFGTMRAKDFHFLNGHLCFV